MILKIHVSIDKSFYVNAPSFKEAKEIMKSVEFGDCIADYNTSLLHIAGAEEIAKLKSEGIEIIGTAADQA